MKKAINIFFVVLGVIFLCILLALGGMYVFISTSSSPTETVEQGGVTVEDGGEVTNNPVDSNPMLNEGQETALEIFGIDPASLPTEITSEQEACFIESIGAARVEEIKAGDTPTATEIFRGRGCL